MPGYRLIVTAGPSLEEDTHSTVHVNSEAPLAVKSDHFSGNVFVRVSNFTSGVAPDGKEVIPTSKYLADTGKATFSIEARGTYDTEGMTVDDLLFGIVFRTSIADRLPSSYGIGVRAMQWFNPNIDFQLEGENPTILAPLFAIMTTANVSSETLPDNKSRQENVAPLLPPSHPVHGETLRAMKPDYTPYQGWFGGAPLTAAQARQKWFSDQQVRKNTPLDREKWSISSDLQNGFIDFGDLSLQIPGMPFTVSLAHYMTGRPVQYCCMSRDRKKMFWCVVFTVLEEGTVL